MVVTDLHGDWDTYSRYRDRFLTLRARGQATTSFSPGDLIHGQGESYPDRSLDILLDILALRPTLSERLIYLLGTTNCRTFIASSCRERGAPFHPSLRGGLRKTPGGHHSPFSKACPLRTHTIWHSYHPRRGSGRNESTRRSRAPCSITLTATPWTRLPALCRRNQRSLLRGGFGKLSGEDYGTMARTYLAVSGPDDPRYDDLLVGFLASTLPDFELLWAALFTRNEQQYGESNYAIFLDALLRDLRPGFTARRYW